MNILFTFAQVFNPNRGGTERVTDVIAKELKKRGHNIYYMNFNREESKMDYDFPAPVNFIDEHPANPEETKQSYINFLKANDIDVIINQGGIMNSCNFFCETGDSKAISISVVHIDPLFNYRYLFNESTTLRNDTKKELFKIILRIGYYPIKKYKVRKYLRNHFSDLSEKSDYICLLSEHYRSSIKSISPAINENKVIAINNPNTFDSEDKTSPKKRNILFVGRMEFGQKKPDRMIKIWKRIVKRYPDWNLYMIGGGSNLGELKRRAQHIPNIHFTGFTDPQNYYKEGSILCMTSNYEGWPMVLAEAMAYGVVPLAFSSFGAIHEILRSDEQKVRPFSIDEYVDKLSMLIENPDKRQALAEEGYKIIEEYSKERIVDIWERKLNRLIKDKSQVSNE